MKPTILAVDDDPIILDMYQAILDDEHNLHLASSGQEAFAFFASHPRLDLILLDIVMPEIDGYSLCQKIRGDPLLAHAKVILVSSKVMLEDRLRGYETGADDYITKPFEASELLAKIKVFLRLKTAEEIDRIKTNFLNLLNHEARTPLTSIFGYVALLQDSPNLTEQEKHFVSQILRSSRVLLRCSEKTALLSDLKLGNIQVDRQKIRLREFLAGRQREFARAANDKRLMLQARIDENLLIEADPKLLGIAIDALLDNAVKFALEGTAVEITGSVARNRVQVAIANDGPQIPAEHQEDIFDELSMQDLDHHHQGLGLSLAIARHIVEAHEGSLAVRNHDRGPVFVVDLKSQQAPASPGAKNGG